MKFVKNILRRTQKLAIYLLSARWTLQIFGMALLVGVWSIATYSGLVQPLFLPTPSAVLDATIRLCSTSVLVEDVLISVYRIVLGYSLAVVVSIPLGFYLSLSKRGEAVIGSIISFIRYIPPSAFVPLFILWFGIADAEKAWLIFIGTAPFLVIMVADAVANTKKEYADVAYTLGATRRDIVLRVVLPQSLPAIWDAARVMIGPAWTLVVLAEIVASTSGLGYLIMTSQRFLQTTNVIAAMFIIGMLGLGTDLLFGFGYKYLFPWTNKTSKHA